MYISSSLILFRNFKSQSSTIPLLLLQKLINPLSFLVLPNNNGNSGNNNNNNLVLSLFSSSIGNYQAAGSRNLFNDSTEIFDVDDDNCLFERVESGFSNFSPKLFDQMPQRNDVSEFSTEVVEEELVDDRDGELAPSLLPPLDSFNSTGKGMFDCKEFDFLLKLFDQMPQRDVASEFSDDVVGEELIDEISMHSCPFARRVRKLCRKGRLTAASVIFSALRHTHPTCTTLLLYPLSSLFALCTNLKAIEQGQQLHALVISYGLTGERYLLRRLTAFYCEFGFYADAEFIVRGSILGDPFHWNLLISAYIRSQFWFEVLVTYNEMVKKGVEADKFTYSSVLRACGKLHDVIAGQGIHARILGSGLWLDQFLWNALVAMYAKNGELGDAKKLFEEIPDRDVVSWNTMISSYMVHEMWDMAFELVEQMEEDGCEANTVTFNTIAAGILYRGMPVEALKLIANLMGKTTVVIDRVTLVIYLSACSIMKLLKLGKGIHGIATCLGFDERGNVRNALIKMYSSCGSVEDADILFRLDGDRGLDTWNSMIAGLALNNYVREAFKILREMARCSLEPNVITMLTVLPLCDGDVELYYCEKLHYVEQLHCYIVKYGLDSNHLICNSLVHIYCKLKRISIAHSVFLKMAKHDVFSYTSLIAGYGMQQNGEIALNLFCQMIQSGITPDSLAMLAVLSACSHSKLLPQGRELFNKMKTAYEIVPCLEHFSCMVHMYANGGLLREAETFIKRMPIKASGSIFATLVKACYFRRNSQIGLQGAKELLRMQTANPSHYLLVYRMYALAGYQEELAQLRAIIMKMGIERALVSLDKLP